MGLVRPFLHRANDGGSLGGHVGKLMVFGYFHVMGVRYG
jgi:hypothetical protein